MASVNKVDSDRQPRKGPGGANDTAGDVARALLRRDDDDLEGRLGRKAGAHRVARHRRLGDGSRRSAASTSTRERWFTSKVAFRPGAGRTRTGRSATRPRSRQTTSSCCPRGRRPRRRRRAAASRPRGGQRSRRSPDLRRRRTFLARRRSPRSRQSTVNSRQETSVILATRCHPERSEGSRGRAKRPSRQCPPPGSRLFKVGDVGDEVGRGTIGPASAATQAVEMARRSGRAAAAASAMRAGRHVARTASTQSGYSAMRLQTKSRSQPAREAAAQRREGRRNGRERAHLEVVGEGRASETEACPEGGRSRRLGRARPACRPPGGVRDHDRAGRGHRAPRTERDPAPLLPDPAG